MASTTVSTENTSTMFAAGDTDSRKTSSQQFAAQIKQLEIEGSKLVAATDMLSDSLGIVGSSTYAGSQSAEERGLFGNGVHVPTSLSALTDISAEQRTISELSLQLDSQSRETERLQRQLYDDAATGYRPHITGRSALSDLEIPITSHVGTTRIGSYPGSRGAEIDFLSTSHVERELRMTKKENAELQERLHELTKMMGQQKEQFRNTVEDLKSQLQDAMHSRNSLLEAKQREVTSQEALITDLQNTVKQLEQANKIQEQTLSEMHEKMSSLQKEQYLVTSSFKDVHSILVDYGRRRGRPLPANLEQLPSYEQNIGTLVETLERDACESEAELVHRNEKIQQLTAELETLRISWEERYNMLMREHQDRLTRLADDHERQLSLANERSAMATQQVSSLQNQLRNIREETNHQTRGSYEHICELEHALSTVKEDRQRELNEWKQKRESLEMAVEQSEKELTMIRAERLEAIRKNAALESRFEGVQETIVRLERECDVEKARVLQLQEKVTEVKGHEEHLTEEIQKKNTLIDQLHQSIGRMQQDYKSQIQNTVASAEKEGVHRSEDRIDALATQLSAVTEKCHALKLEAELTKNEHKNLLEKHATLMETFEITKQKHDAMIANVEHLNNLLRDRSGDIARLTTERDYYYHLLDEKNAELATVNTLKERFEVQLEEREKNFLALRNTAEKAEESAAITMTTAETVKHERDTLQQQMNEKIIEMEKLRHERDDLTKKVRIRERYAKEIDTDNGRRKRELSEANALLEGATAKNSELMEELRQSRYEVSRLGETTQALESRLQEQETELLQQVKTLTHRLKAAENDLRLASKTLKTREVVDGKAVKVAGQMQKEVTEKRSEIDSLHSKIHWLEECMEAARKHEHILQEDNRKLAMTLKRASKQSEKLQAELHDSQCQTRQLHDKINKLEASLEKAVARCGQMQEKLEQQEQDLARTKLKHQLELKELSRARPSHRSKSSNRSSSMSPLRMADAREKSSQGRADAREKSSHGRGERPVSMKPSKEQLQNLASQNAVGEELRQLLGEMKSLIYGQQMQQQAVMQMPQGHGEKTTSDRHSLRIGTLSGYRSATDADQLLNDLDLYMNLRQDSSRLKQAAEGSLPPERDNNVSSVSERVASKSTVYAPEWSPDCDPVKDKSPGYRGSCRRVKKKTPPVDEDATVLCSRLEKKIAGLSKLGGQLQHENKKIARMMRDQDKKLKKVKGQITK